MPWKKILCPVDFSEGSRRSVEEAAKVAIESNAELVLVNVLAWPTYFLVEPIALPPKFEAQVVTAAEEGLAAWKLDVLKQGVTKVSTHVLRGDAAHEIVELAKREGCDLVIIGTHGRTGIRHVVLGSVAEKVVRHAACQVLVVRRGD